MFKGLFTALITPFINGNFDKKSYIKLIENQIENGVNGLIPCGSTGEAHTLSQTERYEVIETCVKVAEGRVPVLAGTGSNSTLEVIEHSLVAKKIGADGVMIVAPYYVKPTQEGIYQHYKTVHDQIDMPIMLYNVPSRSAIDINNETIIRLSNLENIIALKDATGNLARISNIINEVSEDFSIFCGDDALSLGFNAQGGKGCVSVASNIYPKLLAQMQEDWFSGNISSAYNIHKMMSNFYNALFCETNPVPVKYVASLMNICSPNVRLPLVELSEKNKIFVKKMLELTESRILSQELLK